jgi:DNA-binding PadR family transcriptional regulator
VSNSSNAVKQRVGDERELTPGEWCVLALLSTEPAHGWTLASEFGSDRDVGAIWPLSRPLVYRALEILEQRGLIEPARIEAGARGPHRTVFRATPLGQGEFKRWLSEPVEQTRDMQPLFLLKLVFAERAGILPAPIVEKQRVAFSTTVESLEAQLAESSGSEWGVVWFRLESANSVLRLIDTMGTSRRSASRVALSSAA